MLAARTTWRSASPTAAAGKVTDDVVGDGQLRVVVERQRANAELRAAAGDLDVVAVHGNFDLAGAQRADDVGGQPGGQHDATVALATDGQSQLDRQIEIGAGDGELIADELESQTRQHRQRAGAAGGSTSCSGQRVGQASRSQRNFTGQPFSP